MDIQGGNMMRYAIGIDIGETTISSGIMDQHGQLIQQEIVKSEPSDRDKMFENVVSCVEQLIDHSRLPFEEIDGIGVGVPEKAGLAVYQNQFPLVEKLQTTFNKERIVIDHDVYMGALAEWNVAKLQDELFVYMAISTDISSAIIKSGEFIRGAGFAGDMGLIPVHAPHTDRAVNRLENVATGPALQTYANDQFDTQHMTVETLFQAFYDHDATAIQLIDDVATALAQGVYTMTSLLDPHQIVFGGNIATMHPILLDKIKEKLNHYLMPEQNQILNRMTTSHLGNNQGLLGAGLSVFKTFSNHVAQ